MFKKKRPSTVAAVNGQCVIKIQGAEPDEIKRLLRRIRKAGFEYEAEIPNNNGKRRLYSRDYKNL